MSEPHDGWHELFSIKLKNGGTSRITFPLPEELQPIQQLYEFQSIAIEYYLLSRYSYFHHMFSTHLINSFWTAEYLMLSMLCIKYPDVSSLKDSFGEKLHSLPAYWKEAKTIYSTFNKELVLKMEKFDPYVGVLQGYYDERYPKLQQKKKHIFTNSAKVTSNDRNHKFDKSYPTKIDKFDHFVNFVLHDVLKQDGANLGERLLSQDNKNLYTQENNYSIVPPQKYFGDT